MKARVYKGHTVKLLSAAGKSSLSTAVTVAFCCIINNTSCSCLMIESVCVCVVLCCVVLCCAVCACMRACVRACVCESVCVCVCVCVPEAYLRPEMKTQRLYPATAHNETHALVKPTLSQVERNKRPHALVKPTLSQVERNKRPHAPQPPSLPPPLRD